MLNERNLLAKIIPLNKQKQQNVQKYLKENFFDEEKKKSEGIKRKVFITKKIKLKQWEIHHRNVRRAENAGACPTRRPLKGKGALGRFKFVGKAVAELFLAC